MPDGLTFAELRRANGVRARHWHGRFPDYSLGGWTGADWSNAMCGEAGEAANVVKKLRRAETNVRGRTDASEDQLVEKLGDELADTVIYADLLAQFYGLTLGECVRAKFDAVSEREGLPERLG